MSRRNDYEMDNNGHSSTEEEDEEADWIDDDDDDDEEEINHKVWYKNVEGCIYFDKSCLHYDPDHGENTHHKVTNESIQLSSIKNCLCKTLESGKIIVKLVFRPDEEEGNKKPMTFRVKAMSEGQALRDDIKSRLKHNTVKKELKSPKTNNKKKKVNSKKDGTGEGGDIENQKLPILAEAEPVAAPEKKLSSLNEPPKWAMDFMKFQTMFAATNSQKQQQQQQPNMIFVNQTSGQTQTTKQETDQQQQQSQQQQQQQQQSMDICCCGLSRRCCMIIWALICLWFWIMIIEAAVTTPSDDDDDY